MDSLLPYYERELGFLRDECKQLCERYPALTGLLGGPGGGESADPLVERIIQALAMLAGRAAKRHDDGYPRLTEAILGSIEPALLRQFPSSTVVQFIAGAGARPQRIARGTQMASEPVDGVKCTFTTVYDVDLASFHITSAAYSPDIAAPAAGLPQDATARISIGWSGLEPESPQRARVFIDGDRSFSATLRDTLFLNAIAAYVVLPGSARWTRLRSVPLLPVGFGDDEAMMPTDDRSHPAYRLLTEFFAFAEKFNFFDIDLASILEEAPLARNGGTLHIVLRDVALDSDRARMLSGLSARHLQLGCTPAVNLFLRPGVPITVTNTSPDYILSADERRPDAYDIVAVQAVRTIDTSGGAPEVVELTPFYSTHYAQPDKPYWVASRDYSGDGGAVRPPLRIALVDQELEPARSGVQTISTELLCSNGSLPSLLACGAVEGDLVATGSFGAAHVRLLRKPTLPCMPPGGRGSHWKLVSQLALGSRPLTNLGLREFQEMLLLYDLSHSASATRMVNGITGIAFAPAMDWVHEDAVAAMMPGVEIRLSIAPAAFVGTGVHVFCQVLDRFLGMYGQLNLFTRLVVRSEDGRELVRFAARSGKGLA
ncbi:type VI secretion system baseplate subunit TssF [Pseudoduganella sp. GCM10020061]|uniref:type VI secretion system baseplate subunit TssF n=1 Tax=Pseudoduganella sp. GCM10020061 TaxID=3317345 RepID=UPI00362FC0A5